MVWPPMLPQIASRRARLDDLAMGALEGGNVGFGVARIVAHPTGVVCYFGIQYLVLSSHWLLAYRMVIWFQRRAASITDQDTLLLD